MKIRTKIIGTICLTVILLAISTLGVTLYLNRITSKSIDCILKRKNELEMVFQLDLALSKVIMPANDYLIHGDEAISHK